MSDQIIDAMRSVSRDDLDPTDDELRAFLKAALEAAGYRHGADTMPLNLDRRLIRAAYGDE